MSLGLGLIRFFVRIKPVVLRALRAVAKPFEMVFALLVGTVFVPFYRAFYILRKRAEQAWRPAKNKVMVFVTNRYSVHIALGLIVGLSVLLNVQTQDVRAEGFGEKSLMYAFVTQTDAELIEEFATDTDDVRSAAQYRETTGLAAARGIDTIDEAVALVGGTSLSSPAISDSADSIAPRDSVETYVVQTGDTLSTVAAQFGISLNTLLWANNLSVRSVLRPGDELTILPTSGVLHTVKSGDTINKIANTYDAETDDILAFNKLASADDIVIGEDLIVPGGEIQAPTVSTSTSISRVLSAPTTSTSTSTTITSGASGTGSMVWPTDLRVITQYFSIGHSGLDIDCKFTNNNYAADDGIVQYSGWKNGYGYTVEINHGGGIVTRYGHHASLYVTAGESVSKGQAIGLCGTSGRSTGTHLHFEVIVNGKFRNPLEYIR